MQELIVTILTGLLTGVFSAILATIIYEHLKAKREKKPLNAILNFSKRASLTMVLPLRSNSANIVQNFGQPLDILPRTSTEDFLAINNIKSALLKIHWDGEEYVRQPENLAPEEKMNNIFCICSMKSNEFTDSVEKTAVNLYPRIYRVEKSTTSQEYQITDGVSKTESPTYCQTDEYIKNNIPINQLFEKKFIDYCYITKITNHFNPKRDTKIYIIAGIRGIGTWGAGEFLKKEWRQIYDKLDSPYKESNFSALIKITYEKLDIINMSVVDVIQLPD